MTTAPIIRRDNGTAYSVYRVANLEAKRDLLKIYEGDLMLYHQMCFHDAGMIEVTDEFKQGDWDPAIYS